MLKSRECYGNEEAYHNALFRERATLHAFALSTVTRIQVKFLIGNDETAVTKRENIFFLQDERSRSRAYTRQEAENLINFFAIIRDKRVTTYQEHGFIYDVKEFKGNRICLIRGAYQNGSDVIITNNTYSDKAIAEDPGIMERHWLQSLDRFESIIQAFIDACDGKPVGIDPYLIQRNAISIPLTNKYVGPYRSYGLRLNWIPDGRVNSLSIQAGTNSMILYAFNKEGSSTLKEIVDGYIDAMYRVIDDFNTLRSDWDSFTTSIPVVLSSDRSVFMEYVAGRGTYMKTPSGAPEHRGMFITFNSDATIAASKTFFHYDRDFICDLVDGIRFLTDYKVEV